MKIFSWTEEELNQEQSNAIIAPEDILLLACPGSGKTKTLTYKIAYELSRLENRKKRILAITYTHAAAEEIVERIETLGVDTSQLWIGTIHSFCLEWILRPYCVYNKNISPGFGVVDPEKAREIMGGICAKRSTRLVKVKAADCEYRYDSKGRTPPSAAIIKNVIDDYEAHLLKENLIDFNLMLWCSYQILSSTPLASDVLSKIFSYVLVDEYQDTTEIQYHIICKILKAGRGATKLLVVGDPNQSIYESLGGFPIAHKDLEALSGLVIKEMGLTKNYRSSKKLIDYYRNYNAYNTAIDAKAKFAGFPSLITYNKSVSEDKIIDEVVRLIKLHIGNGIVHSEICILAPWWAHLGSITRKLVAALPDVSFDGPGMTPFKHDKDNFWYKLARIALTQAAPDMYAKRIRWANEVLREAEEGSLSKQKISAKSLLLYSNSLTISETDGLTYLERYFAAIKDKLGISYNPGSEWDLSYISFFKTARTRMDKVAAEGGLCISDIESFRKAFKPGIGVRVSTIHGVKGEEYDVVIAFGLIQGLVPNWNASAPAIAAKKLLYVICSRARKHLHLISETGRKNGPTQELSKYNYKYDTA